MTESHVARLSGGDAGLVTATSRYNLLGLHCPGWTCSGLGLAELQEFALFFVASGCQRLWTVQKHYLNLLYLDIVYGWSRCKCFPGAVTGLYYFPQLGVFPAEPAANCSLLTFARNSRNIAQKRNRTTIIA